VKFVPLIVTDVPLPPDVGLNDVMLGDWLFAPLPMVMLPLVDVTPCIVFAFGSKTITSLTPIAAVPLTLASAVKLKVASKPLLPAGALVIPVRL
jgi:hypothetical protein